MMGFVDRPVVSPATADRFRCLATRCRPLTISCSGCSPANKSIFGNSPRLVDWG
jgi:hypothetical protein